jgi:hypothetical protein
MARKLFKNMLFFLILLTIIILGTIFSRNIIEGFCAYGGCYIKRKTFSACEQAKAKGECENAIITTSKDARCVWEDNIAYLTNHNLSKHVCKRKY